MNKRINRALPIWTPAGTVAPEPPSAEQIIRQEYRWLDETLKKLNIQHQPKEEFYRWLDETLKKLNIQHQPKEEFYRWLDETLKKLNIQVRWSNYQTERLTGKVFETLDLAEEFISSGEIYEQTDQT